MNRVIGHCLSALGAFIAFVALMSSLANSPKGHPTYLWNASGFEFVSWGVAIVIAVVLMLAPAIFLCQWIIGRIDPAATIALAFSGSLFLPIVVAAEQTYPIPAILVALCPVAATALAARPFGSLEGRVARSSVLALAHWLGLGLVIPPAANCNYEDCLRSSVWQSGLAVGLLWLGCGRLITYSRPAMPAGVRVTDNGSPSAS